MNIPCHKAFGSKIKLWALLMCLPSLVLAISFESFDISPTPEDFTHDWSLQFLRALFGSVEGVFFGTGGQLLGQMSRILNQGLLIVGVGVLGYIFLIGIISTAQSGEIMGKKWSSHWVPVRVAASTALLLPNASGYCLAQAILMWVVVQGVGLANAVWDEALNYLGAGGTLVIDQFQEVTGSNVSQEGVLDSQADQAGQLLKMATCMQAIETTLRDKANGALVPSFNATIEPSEENMGTPYPFPATFSDDNYNAYTGICGTVTLGRVESSQANNIKLLAFGQLWDELYDIAEFHVRNNYQKIENQDDAVKDLVIEYHFLLRTALQYNTNEAAAENYLSEARRNGWLSAGLYYFDISKLKNSAINSNTTIENITIKTPSAIQVTFPADNQAIQLTGAADGSDGEKRFVYDHAFSGSSEISQYVAIATDHDRVNLPSSGISSSASSTATISMITTIVAMGALLIAVIAAPFGVPGLAVATALAAPFYGKIVYGFANLLIDPTDSPLISLAIIGGGMLDFGITIWVVGAISIFAFTTATSAMASMNPLPYGHQSLYTYMTPILAFIVATMMSSGAILLLYLPMIPFMIFLFSCLGWFFQVIESMVAIPLAALWLANPEGHDIWGKVEPALGLIFNVFVRPVLLIIGFVMAAMLANVSLWLFNQVYFKGVVAAIFTHSHAAYGLGAPIIFIAMIMLYGYMLMVLLHQVFSFIPMIADNGPKWMGFNFTPSYSGQVAHAADKAQGAIGGAVGGASKAGESGAHTGSKAAADAMGRERDQKLKNQEADRRAQQDTTLTGGEIAPPPSSSTAPSGSPGVSVRSPTASGASSASPPTSGAPSAPPAPSAPSALPTRTGEPSPSTSPRSSTDQPRKGEKDS